MEKQIIHEGATLSYVIEGNGQHLVLLHGLAEDRRVWQRQVDFLSPHFRVVVPDLPGSGASAIMENTSMERLARAVEAILAAEDLQEVVMIGHSMGGYVVLAYAEAHPQRLAAFGLFHSTAYADGEEKKAARLKNIEFIHQHGTAWFLKQATPGLFSPLTREQNHGMISTLMEQYRDFDPASLVAYNQAMLERPDRTAVLARAGCPVLMVIGKEDAGIPLRQSLEQSHLPDRAWIHVLQESGHMGFLEEPDKSNRLLKKFLEDVYKP